MSKESMAYAETGCRINERNYIKHPIEGLHLTSIQTMRYMFQTGVLPGTTRGQTYNQLGDISYFPIENNRVRRGYYYNPWEETLSYDYIPVHHALVEMVGGSIDDPTLYELFVELQYANYDYYRIAEFCNRNNVSIDAKEILDIYERAQIYKGVLVAFKDSIARRYEIAEGDPGDIDMKIITNGRGLPAEEIYALIPLGKKESEEMKLYR